jgi:hypothetical protein
MNPNEGNLPAGGAKPVTPQDLTSMGLKIKQGDVQAPGSPLSEKMIEMAKKVQAGIPGFSYFSGFNDSFHQTKSPNSRHAKGLAMDFALAQKPSLQQGQEIVSTLKGMGATLAIDEYNNPSAKATAGHIHAEVSAANGGIATGPKSGYAATLHGTEAIVPLPNGNMIPVEMPGMDSSLSEQNDILAQQLDRMDAMITFMKNQNAISQKLLQKTN